MLSRRALEIQQLSAAGVNLQMSQDALTYTHIRHRSTFQSIESDLQASCKFDAQVVGQDRAGRATAT